MHTLYPKYGTLSSSHRMNFFMNFIIFGNVCENKIVNFPQLQCLVGTSRSHLVNFVKIKL